MYKKIGEATHYQQVRKWIEENLSLLESNLNEIEYLSSVPATQERFDTCLNLFLSIISNIPLVINKLSDTSIIRARANYNGKIFSQQHEISYNSTNKKAISVGRFNDAEESIFYGCLPVKNESINQELNASLESCKELISAQDSPDIQDMTFSEWVIKKQFPTINLCFNEEHMKYNPEIKKVFDEYIMDLRQNFSPDASRFIQRFLAFISNLCCSNEFENCYYVLTALFKVIDHYSRNILKQPFHGIIYPSAMTESKGLNIALLPDAVNNYLQPNHVIMFRYYKVRNEKRYISYPISDVATVEKGIFKLINVQYDQTKNRKSFY